jgi:hypothetical protein
MALSHSLAEHQMCTNTKERPCTVQAVISYKELKRPAIPIEFSFFGGFFIFIT